MRKIVVFCLSNQEGVLLMNKKWSVNLKNLQKRGVSVILGLGLIITFLCTPLSAKAVNANGSVDNIGVSATLYRNQTSASASTTSNSISIIHSVSLRLWYYYTGSNGAAAKTNTVRSAQGANSVHVAATGTGTNVATYGAISQHLATNGTYSWNYTLRDPSNFYGD